MTGKTHAAAGAFIGAVIGQLTGSPLEGFFLGMFAGLLPDIDHPRSTLGRKRKSLSLAVNAIAGHRGITHGNELIELPLSFLLLVLCYLILVA